VLILGFCFVMDNALRVNVGILGLEGKCKSLKIRP
jgi:hypothetical protein